MFDEYKELIQEWFGKCVDPIQVAELYAELRMEIQKQMEFCISEKEN